MQQPGSQLPAKGRAWVKLGGQEELLAVAMNLVEGQRQDPSFGP